MTNYEKICSMTIPEMSAFINEMVYSSPVWENPDSPPCNGCSKPEGSCAGCDFVRLWLEQEVAE